MIELLNKKRVDIRLLQAMDAEALFTYLQQLSAESRSRFKPHSFDKDSVNSICTNLSPDLQRYIATHKSNDNIVAYMLIKQGMIEWDEKRYALRNQFFDIATTVTFAPSVADAWQSSGLGTLMYSFIEDDLRKRGTRTIVLWGGVQAANEKAVNFYKKLDYQYVASFWNDHRDNYDMVKTL